MVAPVVRGQVENRVQAERQLEGIRRASKEALREALNSTAFSLSGFRGGRRKARINAEWHRQMPDSVVRRFPGVLMQVVPERGIPYQAARLPGPMSVEVNSGRGNSELGNRILLRQIRGERKTPFQAPFLRIRQRVVQRNPQTGRWRAEYARGSFFFPSRNPRFQAQRIGQGLRITALIRDEANVPPRFSLDALLAQLPNDIYRAWRRQFRREAIIRLRRGQSPEGVVVFETVAQ